MNALIDTALVCIGGVAAYLAVTLALIPPTAVLAVIAFGAAAILCAIRRNWELALIALGLVFVVWPW